MAQKSASPVLPRKSGRNVKLNLDHDFEYDYVQRRIDQLDRELAPSGLSPHIPHVPSPPAGVSIPARQMNESPVTSQAPVTAQAISTELQLAQLQRNKLALELDVLKLRVAAVETKVADGAESSQNLARRGKNALSTGRMSFVQVRKHYTSRSWSWPTLLLVFSQ